MQGSRRKPYKVTVRVRTYSETGVGPDPCGPRQSGGPPRGLARRGDAARRRRRHGRRQDRSAAGLRARCSRAVLVPTGQNPANTAAAVCYLVADTLDADPFLLFLMRGRDRDSLLGGLRAKRAASRARSRTGRGQPRLRASNGLEQPTSGLMPGRLGRVGRPCPPVVFRRSQPSPFRRPSTGGLRFWPWILQKAGVSLNVTPTAGRRRGAAGMGASSRWAKYRSRAPERCRPRSPRRSDAHSHRATDGS